MTGPEINSHHLVYRYNFIDAAEIQQMLIALQNGYYLDSIVSYDGFVQYILTYKGE